MPDVSRVRWIGGGSGAGKSTAAALLADRFGAAVYSTDDAIAAHGKQPWPDAPLLAECAGMSMDERWVEREAAVMCTTFPWFAGERFDRILRDVAATPAPLLLVEGFRVLPRLVRPLLTDPCHAVFLTPTSEFRRHAFMRRPPERQFWRRTSRPDVALERLLERDALFTAAVADEARQLGMRTITVDGSRPAAAVAADVASWFRLDVASCS